MINRAEQDLASYCSIIEDNIADVAAELHARWDALPIVTLGLEFRHPVVTVFFNLTLSEAGRSVEVLGIAFDAPTLSPHEALSHAFAEARLRDGTGLPLELVRHRRTRLRRP